MWTTLLIGAVARPWVRRAVFVGLGALAVFLFLFNLRRGGERAGRAAERLDMLERTNAVQRQMLEAAARRPRSRDDLVEWLRGGRF
ncbi:hypothetical protein SAMN04490248_12053 [Salinihabitans flavidus]|uniref:Uncharacterized protein n=1 Tax=Salinihabitans flavidus TaxID=569882 RepID=A0A1H8UJ77_9RHOB|nr:hypothetical protein [Salinihabitans flavidus]SEP03221.1 hypothetical protein SAMN04490248_12053 [Salinihabitans flavidus]